MRYKLEITRIEPNPLYDKEKAKEARMYNYNRDMVLEHSEVENQVLTVELTEEEYKAFKKAALEIK